MAVKYTTQYNADGTSMGQDASEKVGFHGKAVVQASAIATAASSLASVKAKLNLLLTACRAKGLIAT
jgi:hypothetical protein